MRTTLALLACPLALTGCLAGTAVQTAHPIGEGNLQVGLEPGIWGAGTSEGGVVLPAFNIAMRYGLDDRSDIGGRFGSTLYEISYKRTLSDPESGGMQTALAPSISAFYFGAGGVGGGWVDLRLPLLFGIPVGESELVLGARAHNILLIASGGGESAGGDVLLLGGQIGFAGRLGPKFFILPEFGLEYPVYSAAGTSVGGGGSGFGGEGALFSFTLGFLVGGE